MRLARWLYRRFPWYHDATTRRFLWWLGRSRAWCVDHQVMAEAALPRIDIIALSQSVDRAVHDEPVAPTQDDLAGISRPTQPKGCGACRLAPSRAECDAALQVLIARLNRRLN
jgi:hypothetical protein